MKKSLFKGILFMDIETVPQIYRYQNLTQRWQDLFKKKVKYYLNSTTIESGKSVDDWYMEKGGIYAEFGKIVCISAAYLTLGESNNTYVVKLKSFSDHNEEKVLFDFKQLLDRYYSNPRHAKLCGHNLKEFDVPFICRRMLINGVSLPSILQLHGKKPWQTPQLLDTLELWKFGDYKHYTSLDLLTACFDIETPKDEMDGSEVAQVYYEENDLDKIVTYCEKDVVSVIKVFLRLQGISDFEIHYKA